MKKLSLLILLVLVASMLVAAIPTKLVRLTVINKSGADVYIKLEGSQVTEAFYYLTIPAGTKDFPTVKIFTVMIDVYERTTWGCGGFESHGSFFMSQNIRLNFLPCDLQWACRKVNATPFLWGCLQEQGLQWHVKINQIYSGEPTMEKVTYLKFLYGPGHVYWQDTYLYTGYWNYGCGLWYWRIRTWATPVGCSWRYQY